jgi:hypothetical protein
MSLYYTLFKAVKAICPSDYKAYFSTLKETDEGVYGFFLKGGAPTNRTVDSGKYLVRNSLVTFNVNGAKGVNGILRGYDFCEEVVKAMESCVGYTYTDPASGKEVVIISVSITGDINSLGVNDYDIPTFSLNFIIKYAGGN